MISDHSQLSIEVTTDKSQVQADISVSLGLIVTELVINALKHAFPAGRHGKIMVDYLSRGPNWTLSIADDGIGIASEPAGAPAGLGTSIVEALARQLRAHIQVANANPGTNVSIIHTQIAVVDSKPNQAAV